MGVKCDFIVVLICISLRTNNVSIFSCAYWTFLYLLWRNDYSSLLPVFELDIFAVVVGENRLNSIYSKSF